MAGRQISYEKQEAHKSIHTVIPAYLIPSPAEEPSSAYISKNAHINSFKRSRSTSWSTPLRPPGLVASPKRILSPIFFKKTNYNLNDLNAKQEKAQEKRDSLVHLKVEKIKEVEAYKLQLENLSKNYIYSFAPGGAKSTMDRSIANIMKLAKSHQPIGTELEAISSLLEKEDLNPILTSGFEANLIGSFVVNSLKVSTEVIGYICSKNLLSSLVEDLFRVFKCQHTYTLAIATNAFKILSEIIGASEEFLDMQIEIAKYLLLLGLSDCMKAIQLPANAENVETLEFVCQYVWLIKGILALSNKVTQTAIKRKYRRCLVNNLPISDITNLLFMMNSLILSDGGSYRCAGEALMASQIKQISLGILKTLNCWCTINCSKVQQVVQTLDSTPQIFHFMLFWMHYRDSGIENCITVNEIVDECLKVLYNICWDNEIIRAMMLIGLPDKSLVQRLVQFPFRYFNTKEGRDLLFPLLLSLSLDENNRRVIKDDLSVEFLLIYLERNKEKFPKSLYESLKKLSK
ncbi:hypothetical protein HDV01_006536 [Terramyces sp. JEL0728]|nr:hypothetical protein HDV01_006536 [Terramyces sp. JEL0728]